MLCESDSLLPPCSVQSVDDVKLPMTTTEQSIVPSVVSLNLLKDYLFVHEFCRTMDALDDAYNGSLRLAMDKMLEGVVDVDPDYVDPDYLSTRSFKSQEILVEDPCLYDSSRCMSQSLAPLEASMLEMPVTTTPFSCVTSHASIEHKHNPRNQGKGKKRRKSLYGRKHKRAKKVSQVVVQQLVQERQWLGIKTINAVEQPVERSTEPTLTALTAKKTTKDAKMDKKPNGDHQDLGAESLLFRVLQKGNSELEIQDACSSCGDMRGSFGCRLCRECFCVVHMNVETFVCSSCELDRNNRLMTKCSSDPFDPFDQHLDQFLRFANTCFV